MERDPSEKSALLIYAASETDANLYYISRFLAPDPFVYVRINGRNILVMSDLEVDRAKSQAKADEVISMSHLMNQARGRGVARPGMPDALDELFKPAEITRLEVPGNFPLAAADLLRRRGYEVLPKREPFFEQRTIKTAEEIEAITATQRATEEAVQGVVEMIRESEIKGDELWLKGKPLTSETLRKLLHITLMGMDCIARHSIIAGGEQACDPHRIGSGVLRPHQPIVLDIFPQSAATRYYADMSRTVVKGNPSEKVKKMYAAVREGQEIGFRMLKAGVDGKDVHDAILDYFEKEGFKTGEVNGRMQGFFHGTGHGVGIEIHEPPRVSSVSDTIKAGHVVTVEPGLYYPGHGGVRLEDMVVITETGCRNLTRFPKILELD
ncbi:MAG: aminopeptidase P family protein [Candidatus Omnitrophica bacterium]|nr:aminopeptidase P family protein [Candidatus Omnitrophota bacterium]